jgi:hypothetical protein
MTSALCTAAGAPLNPLVNFDLNLCAKHALSVGRKTAGLSRAQLARCLGHADERLVRTWEEEGSTTHFPVDALFHPHFPEKIRAFVLAEMARVAGTQEPTGADSAEEALLAHQRAAGQFVTGMGTTMLRGRLSSEGAAQALRLVENDISTGQVAARLLRRRVVTGSHPAVGGGGRGGAR